MGFVPNARHGNHGGAGNTLEDLLGIEENNLPIPNAAEWELKTHKTGSASLVTLFHSEPSPRAVRFVPSMLLPLYGWPHQQARGKYPETEMSFRQTIAALRQVIADSKSSSTVRRGKCSFRSTHSPSIRAIIFGLHP